ncbi:sigma-54 dependent transcriptional regulator [Ideonella sp.]|uniref:sigma-54-dependent transcriptional regulator n=1 Tax=Ideonella sp. TaxID=1929293 RepID=UPI002B4A3EEC|nr:sigma-54 dependent transcriptional regulator [Ideonella sp.]HJV69266.1 sigma-54 dependent transcriptional regulator [Ideonella sp.]
MTRAILIIDDEETLARNLALYLERQGWETRVAGSAEDGLAQFNEFRPDVVLLDHNLPGMTGLEALQRLKAADPAACVVMMTGHGGIDLAVTAMKAGAADYLTKPLGLAELKLTLERLMSQGRLETTVHYYAQRQAEGSGLDKIVGRSPAMLALRERIATLLESEQRLADSDAPAVLIQGETGTGKELVARALHFDGPRRAAPFVELNCGALPANLVEAELFGYERGAFTDARQRKAGLVETAEGGTLFLDEIGEADASTQVKLLKLLEDKRFRRLGGLRDQRVNVRIVSASHRPLEQMVKAGQFRADLYYRLRIVELKVPPLRERGNDILDLARHFLRLHGHRYRKGDLHLSPAAAGELLRHKWPGNVRELRNAMEQVALLVQGEEVGVRDLGLAIAGLEAVADEPAGAEAAGTGDLNLERAERRLIERALERTAGNVTQAARLLGISRDTLRYRLERLGLRTADGAEADPRGDGERRH